MCSRHCACCIYWVSRPWERVIVKLNTHNTHKHNTHNRQHTQHIKGKEKRTERGMDRRRKGVKEQDGGRRIMGSGWEGGLTSLFSHECVYVHKKSQQLNRDLESRFFPKREIRRNLSKFSVLGRACVLQYQLCLLGSVHFCITLLVFHLKNGGTTTQLTVFVWRV